MAHAELHNVAHVTNIANVITAPFKAVWNFLLEMGEYSALAQQVNQLNALSDEQLAERGLSREDVVRQIFGNRI